MTLLQKKFKSPRKYTALNLCGVNNLAVNMGSQRIGHNWMTEHTYTHKYEENINKIIRENNEVHNHRRKFKKTSSSD